eukprot:9470428-Pyramimonas_sp.AAC.1
MEDVQAPVTLGFPLMYCMCVATGVGSVVCHWPGHAQQAAHQGDSRAASGVWAGHRDERVQLVSESE